MLNTQTFPYTLWMEQIKEVRNIDLEFKLQDNPFALF